MTSRGIGVGVLCVRFSSIAQAGISLTRQNAAMERAQLPAAAALARQFDQAVEPATFPAAARIRDAVAAWAPRGGLVVDLGCRGGQSLAALAARRPDLTLIGVEPERALALKARARLGSRAEVADAPLTALPIADGVADVVVSSYSLGRFEQGPTIAREIARVLAPGGRGMFAELDAHASESEWASFLRGTRLPRGILPMVTTSTFPLLRTRGVSVDVAKRIAEEAGLDVLRAGTLRGLATGLVEVQRPAAGH